MSSLTDKQKKALNEAILEYLRDNGYEKSMMIFKDESHTDFPTQPQTPTTPSSPTSPLTPSLSLSQRVLEKKWTAIIALTKKVHELQTQLEEKENELKEALPFQYGHALANKIDFRDALPSEVKFQLTGHRRAVNKVLFHPNTTWVATASDDGMIGIWDVEDGRNVKYLKGHNDIVQDISFNYNGTLLVSCSADTTVRVWSLEDDFRCTKTLRGHDHSVTGVVFLRMPGQWNQIVSCGRDGTIRLWDLDTGFNTHTLRDAHGGEWVKKLCLSLEGSLFASASTDQTVRIWDSASLKCLSVLRGHEHVVECIAFSNQKVDEIISGKKKTEHSDTPTSALSEDHQNGGDENGATSEHYLTKTFNSDNKPRYLASGARDKNIIIWDLQNERPALILKGHGSWVRSVLFHPCGKYLFSCADDKSIKIWDLVKQRQLTTIQDAHDSFVSSIDWNPTLEILASSSNSKDAKLWLSAKTEYTDGD